VSRIDPRYAPLSVMTIGTFMSILDSNIVNIALPEMLQDFDASLAKGQLIITSYVMALAVVIPLSGFLGERVGMKRLYIATLACFTIGSALCGLAWNIESLIFFRVLQGLGGGMLMPLGMALIFTIITPLERPRFVSLLGIPALLAPLMGPSLGGYIVEYADWRAIFLINVPAGVFAIFLATRWLKETPLKTDTRLDFWGFLFAAIAFPSILLGMSLGEDLGWISAAALSLLAVGGFALGAFIRTELRQPDPLIRIRLFSIPMFRLSLFVQWIGFFSLFGLNVVIPLFLQRVQGMGPAEAGRILLPMGIVAFITMNITGRLYERVGPRPLVMSGMAVLAVTTFLWSRVPPDGDTLALLVLVAGRGVGFGLAAQIVQVVAYNTVPQGQLPRATSLLNICQRLVTAFSTALLTTALIVGLRWTDAPEGTSISAGTAPVDDMAVAFDYAFLMMTGLSILGFVLASRLRDDVREEARRTATPRRQQAERVAAD
jgi:EmrB/QacA subfamily drug resistance transporter